MVLMIVATCNFLQRFKSFGPLEGLSPLSFSYFIFSLLVSLLLYSFFY